MFNNEQQKIPIPTVVFHSYRTEYRSSQPLTFPAAGLPCHLTRGGKNLEVDFLHTGKKIHLEYNGPACTKKLEHKGIVSVHVC